MERLDDWRVARRPVLSGAEALRALAVLAMNAESPLPVAPAVGTPKAKSNELKKAATKTVPRAATDPRQLDVEDFTGPAAPAPAKEPTKVWNKVLDEVRRRVTHHPGWKAYTEKERQKNKTFCVENLRARDKVLAACHDLGIEYRDVFTPPA